MVLRRSFLWMLAGGATLPASALADDDAASIPNTFISPCGKPFRAPAGAPYPVATWFAEADKNADGKLDHAEFVADADAFFKVLDLQNQGVLDRYDIQIYEYRIAPEVVVGFRPAARLTPSLGARLWLAQATGQHEARDPYSASPQGLDESSQGASPYSFFDEPEPVMAADFNVNGFITRANFLKLADMHFASLDPDNRGFLTLDSLPKTRVQREIEALQPKPRRR